MVVTPYMIAGRALATAVGNLGYGEEGANNVGPLIEAMGGQPGNEWCALFVRWCYLRAFEQLAVPPTFKLDRAKGRPEVGAKNFADNAARAGRRFKDPSLLQPGDIICWHRPPVLSSGHIGIVESYQEGLVHTIEGNVGRFPARVKRLIHDVSKERLYTLASIQPPQPQLVAGVAKVPDAGNA